MDNTAYKSVKYLLAAETIDMGGFPVKQALPTQKIQQVDPFLLLHHAKVKFSNNRPAKMQGVGPHPHRGFSPVTFVIQGEVHHQDSRNHNQIATAGEVQWMHAGAGIVHSERPSEKLVQANGKQEIIQLWINSPAASKMKIPNYQYLPKSAMPVFNSKDNKVQNKLIAGNYNKLKGTIKTESDLLIIWGNAKENSQQEFIIPEGFTATFYLINGKASIKKHGLVEAESLVIFEKEGNTVLFNFKEKAQFLLLCGKPINEKVTQYGPFVMNSQTEIMQAMRDYQMGKMGILIEE